MSDRQGIEIDYCPQCRGIWLDRGELDKIIERITAEQPSFSQKEPIRDRRYYDDDYYKRKKRKSWISEIFDF